MKINAEMKTNIHNKFKIEVKRNDEIIQEGFAENMVLDRMYTRLMSFSTFFTRIHVGGGTGILSPDRTTLFSPITYKDAIVDEIVKAYPVSSVTKKITFGTTEQIGKTFTEVGISEATNAINTHALIKDAEGNPLSITKTDTDIITIYATVYLELVDDTSVDGKFNQIAWENPLVNYVIDGSTMTSSLWIGPAGGPTPFNRLGFVLETRALTRAEDIVNRVNTYTTRLDTNHANFDIREFGLGNIFRVDLENATSWSPFRINDIDLGIGDGITTEFEIGRYTLSNLEIKIDNSVYTDFQINSSNNGTSIPAYAIALNKEELAQPQFNNTGTMISPYPVIEIDPTFSTEGVALEGRIIAPTSTSGWARLWIDCSEDNGETFTNVGVIYASGYGKDLTDRVVLSKNYTHIKFRTTSSHGDGSGRVQHIVFIQPTNKITFAVPPIEGALITASYTVPYIPKTEDYVIDLSLDLHW